MIEKLYSSPSLQSFKQELKAPALLIEGLWQAPKALLTSLAAQALKKNILIISSSADDRLMDELTYFMGAAPLDLLSWETLPGEEIAPSADITGKRLQILYQLATSQGPWVLHCPLQSLLQRTLSKKRLQKSCLLWKKGQTLPFMALPSKLEELGYKKNAIVSDKGEFALRGGIIDIFPISEPQPYRLDFFGDTLEDIRTFDPIGQRSTGKVDSLFLAPASEWQLLQEEEAPSLLWDYIEDTPLIVFNDPESIEEQMISLEGLPGAKSRLFSRFSDHLKIMEPMQKLFFTSHPIELLSDKASKDKTQPGFLAFDFFSSSFSAKRFSHPFEEVAPFFCPSSNAAMATPSQLLSAIAPRKDFTTYVISSSEAEENSFKERLSHLEVPTSCRIHFHRGYLSSGFVLPEDKLILLPQAELTHRLKTQRQKWRTSYHTPASEFHALSAGDIVVHLYSGIGKFLGVEKQINHQKEEVEFLVIEYADSGKLFVPISQSHLVTRYIGSTEETPTLSTLGSNRWQKTYLNAHKAILGYAKELLEREAAREIQGGFAFSADGEDVTLFEEQFPFVETEDQIAAIAAIKEDMQSKKAMDRLICGDVGYGKTEVAMRAAFKACVDGKKQVAVLVPTTVLAMQHYENFKERMASFPVNIGVISRFVSAKTIKQTLADVEEGKIDILIGTHRIISGDVRFKDLGLLIIDEEQRFGVRAKEFLKKAKTGVDCLTLSATPIPRTLHMSLVGAREISLINTPPQDRLPIKSILAEKAPELIQGALLRELSRKGQAYFIHNRVETIFQVKEELQRLLPKARIVAGHGQMPSEEIDAVFHAFKKGDADILVATSIVENGIDIPNANTILIDKADQFGIADLYQLRGRVGRWNKPAYAYFLINKGQKLTDLSRKRIAALIESSGHGGGMKVAMRDLEIRGAGDILGVQQSGQVSAVGFHLYCRLLKKTIEAIKKNRPIQFQEAKIESTIDARLPEHYIAESSLRMEMYNRLGQVSHAADVDAIYQEITDRFGAPPPPVEWLIALTKIRLGATSLGVTTLKIDKKMISYQKIVGKTLVKKSAMLAKAGCAKDFEASVLLALKS